MEWIKNLDLDNTHVLSVLQAGIILILGLVILQFLKRTSRRFFQDRIEAQQMMLLQRFITYLCLGLIFSWVLHELGFSISVLLGAAGILTVALGFASQTSVSNVISGLFLIGERPFVVGNVIEVDGTLGEVLSIDLLSVKLRTVDNLYIRIPNETMLKSKVTNLHRFPIRRLDIDLGVSYDENIEKVRDLLFQVGENNPLCLEEPKPIFIFKGFGDSSIDLQFSVWAKRENFLDLRNSVLQDIKNIFDLHHIEIPFPHRTVQYDQKKNPILVKIMGGDLKHENS